MPRASEEHLLLAYRHQIDWLMTLASELDGKTRRVVGHVGGKEIDLTPHLAEECRHRAGNMEAVLQAYERFHTKEP
jgi:hypothetical protein